MNILQIDDNLDITKLVKAVLESEEHKFTSIDNGKDGLQLIRDNKYDVVLLDLSMPGMSGMEVVDALTKEGLMDKQKIVLFTASSVRDEEIGDSIQKGVHSCIRKPVDIDTLTEKMEQIEEETK
jgi:CheY-like chemotaxis protein